MILILIGLLLIFIPLPIPLRGDDVILLLDYMPHWLGYALILWGLARQKESSNRTTGMVMSVAAILASGAIWGMLLTGVVVSFPLVEIFQLLLTYYILVWCEEQEEMGQSYHIGRFRMSWYALVGARVASVVLGAVMASLSFVWAGAALGTGLFYTWTFFQLQSMVER